MSVLIFGLGYSSSAFARRVGDSFGALRGTHRRAIPGTDGLRFDGVSCSGALSDAIASASILLVSTPPNVDGDPVLRVCKSQLKASQAQHILYLSTIGVYGDQAGAWIDGKAALRSSSERGQWRIDAERQWLDFGKETGIPVQIFRLGGIYGPGRNPLVDLAAGTSRRIFKPDQVFNRIHVDDIALVLEAAILRGKSGAIWNVVDDEPAPPQDVIAFAAKLSGASLPPLLDFETADMTPMARSFYADNRRVSNRALKGDLGIALQYPTYREGMETLFKAGEYHPERPSLRPRDRKAAAAKN
jgi:nucleoside-diphosphate-sugar epimerase